VTESDEEEDADRGGMNEPGQLEATS